MGDTLVILTIPVGNPPAILKTFNQIQVWRTVDNGVSYAEITSPSTRIKISPSVAEYFYEDPNGDASYSYSFAFYNSTTGASSSLSVPIQQGDSSYLSVISVSDLLNTYLNGVNLTTPSGAAFPTSMYEFYIAAGVGYVERKCDICIVPTVIKNEVQDYFPPTSPYTPLTFKTAKVPTQTVQNVRMQLPGMYEPYTYPREWVTLRPSLGRITIFPKGPAIFPLPIFSPYAFMSSNGFGNHCVPNALQVDYTAGFDVNKIPAEIKHVVGMVSTLGIFAITGDLIGGAGIASSSLSIDGLSQSINTTSSPMFAGYGARMREYEQMIAKMLPIIRSTYRGSLMASA